MAMHKPTLSDYTDLSEKCIDDRLRGFGLLSSRIKGCHDFYTDADNIYGEFNFGKKGKFTFKWKVRNIWETPIWRELIKDFEIYFGGYIQ